MTQIAVMALLALTLIVVVAAMVHSVRRMTDDYQANRRRFAINVLATPLVFVLLAVGAWVSGPPLDVAALPFMVMAWLAILFWGEL